MQKKNRSRERVELELLNACRMRPIKSELARGTNLSNDQVGLRLAEVIKKGFVVVVEEVEKKRSKFSEYEEKRVRYAITESGEKRRKALEAVFGEQPDKDVFK